MTEPVFFRLAKPLTIDEVIALTGATLEGAADPARLIRGVAPLDVAGPDDLVFLDNPKYADDLTRTSAAACLVAAKFAPRVPAGTATLVSPEPYRAAAIVTMALFPEAARPGSVVGAEGVSPGSFVHPQARLEPGVTVDPGAVIGAGAEIGSGTVIAANAVIGPQVRIGRDCSVGPNASILHALIGDRVIIHPGVRIGQDGYGFAMSPRGHLKVPQIGRVIVQNDVEIGANSCIDRGANRDTVIGEGTKIDNLVQIGHNVQVGRHCIIVSQVGISGSTRLEDFVALGGQVGLAGHLTIGMGAQVAGGSSVGDNIPRGERWGGYPARPVKNFFREMTYLAILARRRTAGKADPSAGGSE
ncbi:MAG: UDP-3-O-(3-hydroxymyristoyl)glucosamine N-acyltransferase [Alsobacter sp.]